MKTPDIGLIQLLRYNKKLKTVVTINEHVKLLNNFFDLKCIINHIGELNANGHYHAYIKSRNIWLCVDDQNPEITTPIQNEIITINTKSPRKNN